MWIGELFWEPHLHQRLCDWLTVHCLYSHPEHPWDRKEMVSGWDNLTPSQCRWRKNKREEATEPVASKIEISKSEHCNTTSAGGIFNRQCLVSLQICYSDVSFSTHHKTVRFQRGSLEVCRLLTIDRVQVSNSKNSHGASWATNSGSPQPALEAEDHCSTEQSHQENQQQEPDARRSRERVRWGKWGSEEFLVLPGKNVRSQQDWLRAIWGAEFLQQCLATTHTCLLNLECLLSSEWVDLARWS